MVESKKILNENERKDVIIQLKEGMVLTKKRCGVLLIIACFVYLVLNIVFWDMNLVTAISGAICATIAFGLFLYFIKEVSKEKERINGKKIL